jgi:hypothetical protein
MHLQGAVNVAEVRSFGQPSEGACMNSPLPIEGQQVQVKLKDGDWQEAVYRDENFVDLYGLPLEFDKILRWRPMSSNTHVNGTQPPEQGAAWQTIGGRPN